MDDVEELELEEVELVGVDAGIATMYVPMAPELRGYTVKVVVVVTE